MRSACQGAVSVPGEDRYDEEVATWNLAVRLRPALVVGARAVGDVVAAVRWAARLGLAIGVNATGHGAVPNADGALLINTRRLSRITIDPRHATAIVGAGARMGDVTAAAARYGLAPVQGSSGSAGAAGFTLGGGLGVLSRRFGMAADHVLSINVVTSDGRLRTVDADRHPELFWALRGGKGNFGVVTSYRTALVRLAAFYERGSLLDQLTPDTIDAVVREASAPGSPLMLAEIRQLGGAIARPPVVPSAVPGRTAPFVLFAIALDIPPLAEAGPRAVASLLEAVRPWRSPVNVPNFLGRSSTPAEVQAAWPDQSRARLLDIKQGWDLANMFRVGHALLPAPAEVSSDAR